MASRASMEEKQNKVVSIVIESHLYLEDFNQLVEQLQKLEGFVFVVKSEIYTRKLTEENSYEDKKRSSLSTLLASEHIPQYDQIF